MNKFLGVLLVLAMMLLSVNLPVFAEGHDMDPAEVVKAVYAAVSAHDVEGAGGYLADDVVLVILPAPPGTTGAFVGKEAVLGWFEGLSNENTVAELSGEKVEGDRVTINNKTTMDTVPIPLYFHGTGVVTDGMVNTMSWVMTPESQAALDAAMQKVAVEELVKQWLYHWDTVEGDMEGIEDILSEDFVSHNMPEGDRDVMIADVAAFREENPGTYSSIDDLIISGDKVYLSSRLWVDGEPVTPPLIVLLGIKDGKISERTLFAPMQP